MLLLTFQTASATTVFVVGNRVFVSDGGVMLARYPRAGAWGFAGREDQVTDIDGDTVWVRQGARWSAYDYRVMVGGIMAGNGWDEIADDIGRSVKTVKGRASFLLTDGDKGRGKACDRLREQFAADPDYDWETIARANHARAGLAYWDEASEQLLRDTWAASVPARHWLRRNRASPTAMTELVRRLPAPEFEICDHLVALGLSASYAEIADRLGAIPGGSLEQRARLARADHSVAQYVLVGIDGSGDIAHTSVHSNRKDAEHAGGLVQARKGVYGTRITRRVIGRIFDTDLDDDPHTRTLDRPAPDGPPQDASATQPAGLVDLDEMTSESPEEV